MTRSGAVTAALCAAALVLGSAGAQTGGNLIANAGGEDAAGAEDSGTSVPVPGWETSARFTAVRYGAPEFPTPAESARIGGGANFLAGGPDSALATARQTVDVSGSAAAIDAGRLQATLSAWLGGFASQDDNATVAAVYRSAGGGELARTTIGPVTAAERGNRTSFRPRSGADVVPPGTRAIQIVVTARRTAGSYNDGYADNIGLALGPAPVPVAGKSVNVTPVSGTVLVRVRGTNRFVNLARLRNVPVGSELDVTRGRVRLVSAAGARKTQSGVFYSGRAIVRQPRAKAPVTTLQLSGALACPKRAPAAAKPPRVRRLWGNGTGRFSTKGRFASAAVRGTIWLTEDRCDGTLIRVRQGRVAVRDLVRNRTVTLRAGQRYLARAR